MEEYWMITLCCRCYGINKFNTKFINKNPADYIVELYENRNTIEKSYSIVSVLPITKEQYDNLNGRI